MGDEWDKFYDYYCNQTQSTYRSDVVIGKIDGEKNNQIKNKYGIFTYPSIIYFNPDSDRPADIFRIGLRSFTYFQSWAQNNIETYEKKKAKEKEEQEAQKEMQPLLVQPVTQELLQVKEEEKITQQVVQEVNNNSMKKDQIKELYELVSKVHNVISEQESKTQTDLQLISQTIENIAYDTTKLQTKQNDMFSLVKDIDLQIQIIVKQTDQNKNHDY